MSIPPPPLAPQFKSTRPPPKQVCDSSGPAFLADIKAGRSLRKVPDSEKKDRSAPFTSREANRNNESSVTGPTSVASGNIPLTGLPNLFANGVPKLKSVGSVDVTRGTVQNPTTKQPTCGYVKSPAPPPPPPQTSPPPSPPPTSSAVQNNFLSSTKVTTVPPAIYHRPSQTTNIVTAVRNGLPAPPTPARPAISKNNSNYPRYGFYKSPSVENKDPVVPSVIPSPPIQITLSSIPTSPRIGAMTVHESNNNISNNNDNSSIAATTTAPPPPSGRSPRRKQSSSNRYQRAGSTNADVNGIPVGQSTKVIRISSHLNGDLTDHGLSAAVSVNPSLPSSVHDMNTISSRSHPIPPPPPPIQPTLMNNNNMHSNNISSLVRHFESRFTFPDIGHVPVPKAYRGPKTYRVGSNNNNNTANDSCRNQVPYRTAPPAPRNY
ncbi:hypothetical protein KSF78_0009154 [Schistosoma japonicum]|nr:hypothetical protein KSF78_0009154 [Schistosoma japonicum]